MTRDETERIDELLAGRALGDLDRDEATELDALLAANADMESDDFDRAAAAVATLSSPASVLPSGLRSRILQEAPQYIPSSEVSRSEVVEVADLAPPNIPSRFPHREALAWAVAASCLFVLLSSNFYGPSDSPSPAEVRLALLQESDDVVTLVWTAGPTPFDKTVAGDVVWSNENQKGFMRFVDMPVNDPTVEQYQLWIIDPERDDDPIDGGVFDVSETGEVIVPIDAKLKVLSPTMFAVTIEKPGGVVVSSRDRLPLVATVP